MGMLGGGEKSSKVITRRVGLSPREEHYVGKEGSRVIRILGNNSVPGEKKCVQGGKSDVRLTKTRTEK